MELTECILRRRSGRIYNGKAIPEAAINSILLAGLLAPSSRNLKPVEMIVVQGKAELESLAGVKSVGADMLRNADCAIVVIGDCVRSDVWVEDCAIAMTYMMLKATELGIANCWVQCRRRFFNQENGNPLSAGDNARQLLGIPEKYDVLAILSLGMADELPSPRTITEADFTKVHKQTY